MSQTLSSRGLLKYETLSKNSTGKRFNQKNHSFDAQGLSDSEKDYDLVCRSVHEKHEGCTFENQIEVKEMGYRLEVCNKDRTINFYGTKHYGYSFVLGHKLNKECLKYPSYCYLKDLGKVEGDEYWNCGLELEIVLTHEQFNRFIELYADEYDMGGMLEDKNIQKLMADTSDKIISWS